jgi:outer membrane protein OmpA-like peptidoglycan-associated protein
MKRSGRSEGGGLRALSKLSIGILLMGFGNFASAEDGTSAADINQRLYQQLEGNPSSAKIETVSGQMYLSQENLDRAVINDALAAMLDQGQSGDTSVAVRSAPRLNFEIHFRKNSADLTPESQDGLDELGEVLGAEFLDTRFVLGGHTDLDGDATMNGPLSQARADTARSYLIEKHGIASGRLIARGFGEEEPLREVEESAQDKLYNRRVDLRPLRDDSP